MNGAPTETRDFLAPYAAPVPAHQHEAEYHYETINVEAQQGQSEFTAVVDEAYHSTTETVSRV